MSTRPMRSWAVVVLAAMPLLLGAWTLSDNGVPHWDPNGKVVVKTPDEVSLVIHSSFCSFGRHGYVRLRFGGRLAGHTTDMLYLHLVAHTREGNPAVLDIFDGVVTLGPKWDDAPHTGTAHVQVARRRGTFVLVRPGDVTGKARYTGSWKCG